MTFLEFDRLDEEKQVNLLRAYGVLVAERVAEVNRYYLYALSSFYVELCHDLFQSDRIKLVRSFEDPQFLDLYLNDMDISSLSTR